jgi:hypothetical protein
MSNLKEYLAVNSTQTYKFFYNHLRSKVPPRITDAETEYIAGILAHYAQTSRFDTRSMGPAANLFEILDTFVIPELREEGSVFRHDSEMLEIAGAQTLLLVGFFRDQMAHTKNNLKWYDSLGQGFFLKASAYATDESRAMFLWTVSDKFPIWISSCLKASRAMREDRYLLRLN